MILEVNNNKGVCFLQYKSPKTVLFWVQIKECLKLGNVCHVIIGKLELSKKISKVEIINRNLYLYTIQ